VGDSGAQGLLNLTQIETADPWQNGQPFAAYASSGFGYASFLLGTIDSIGTTSQADARLGRHNYSLYLQDSWKVTRKLTLELELRWDYENLWTKEHGRMQSAAWGLPDETIGGRPGAVEYMATCHCQFSNAYPYSIGPHLGVAYQIAPNTVFRAGGAISYGAGSDNAELNGIFQDQIGVNAPGYGIPAGLLKYGDPYGVGNVYGNPVVKWQTTFLQNDYFPPPTTSGLVIPSSPFVSIANNAGRLPRIFQWSVGLQRQITATLWWKRLTWAIAAPGG
jgi:TonB dependent receptor